MIFFLIIPIYCFSLEKVRVLYVIDGDTIKVLYHGKKESVRLIGIDCPESRRNARAKKIAERSKEDLNIIIKQGKAAKKFTKSLVKKGDMVELEFDVTVRDFYHRLLAYVYLANGKMLNEEIIQAGYASPLTIQPNSKYADKFLEEFRKARENKKGLWH